MTTHLLIGKANSGLFQTRSDVTSPCPWTSFPNIRQRSIIIIIIIIIIIMLYSAHVVVYIGFINSQISELFLVSFC